MAVKAPQTPELRGTKFDMPHCSLSDDPGVSTPASLRNADLSFTAQANPRTYEGIPPAVPLT